MGNINEFEELRLNHENQKWLEVLCNNPENVKIFKEQFLDESSPMMSVLAFRDYLLKTTTCSKITSSELKDILRGKDTNKKLKILSEIFLEPVNLEEVNYIDFVGISADDIIKLHNNHKELRLASILTSWKILLEQDLRLKSAV